MADEEQEGRGFKVHDRRRFSDSGESRSEEDTPATEQASPQPAPDEAAPSAATGEPSAAGQPAADAGATEATVGGPTGENAAPEINFPTFVISLSTQALAHLGEIPDPMAGAIQVDLGAARQLIDILGMLKEKTAGNLDTDEATLLEHALYDLRMKYVERANKG